MRRDWRYGPRMYHVVVEWVDEKKTRARFSLPGRIEWSAQHIDELIRVLAEIREEMSPAVPEDPPASAERARIARFLEEQESAWQRYRG